MLKIRGIIRAWLADRRREQRPVQTERRGTKRMKDADRKLSDSIENLDRTVRMKREDLFKRENIATTNDAQQVVIFSTYRDICPAKGPEISGVRLCRNKSHPDAANSELPICEELKCPTLAAALKGAA